MEKKEGEEKIPIKKETGREEGRRRREGGKGKSNKKKAVRGRN